MAAPPKYNEETRAFIHTAINEERRPATKILNELEHRFNVKPSLQHVREIARQERKAHAQDITTQPVSDQRQALVDGLVKATHAEIERILADDGPTDADQLLKLTKTVNDLAPLLKQNDPDQAADQAPKGLLGTLTTPPHATPVKPRRSHTHPVRSGATSGVRVEAA